MTGGHARRLRGAGAQATVELALVLPVVVLLLLAVLQVGLVARDAVLVGHAAREAARSIAVDPDLATARQAAASNSGLRPERIEVTVTGRSGTGSRAEVTVRYRSPTSVAVVGRLLPEPTLVSTLTVRVE